VESLDVVSSLRERVSGRLLRPEPALLAREPTMPALKQAAVLISIVERDSPTVLFTRRTDHLSSHAGQICFPGGRFQGEDVSLTYTALREAEEEIGIPPSLVEVAGYLRPYESGSGYAILPVVGFVSPHVTMSPNADEVADVFEVPLSYLRDARNHQRRLRERDGALRPYHAIAYQHHTIWGLTAALVINLTERLGDL
jgi:8-oxo-dGTP pyrophosphatase MutT (NUDIX family)